MTNPRERFSFTAFCSVAFYIDLSVSAASAEHTEQLCQTEASAEPVHSFRLPLIISSILIVGVLRVPVALQSPLVEGVVRIHLQRLLYLRNRQHLVIQPVIGKRA